MINTLQTQLLQAMNVSSAGIAQSIAKIRIPEPDFSAILAALHNVIAKIDANPFVAPVNAMVNNLQSQLLQAINLSSTRLVQAMANLKIEIKSPSVVCPPPVTEVVVPQPQLLPQAFEVTSPRLASVTEVVVPRQFSQSSYAPVPGAWRRDPSPTISRQSSLPRRTKVTTDIKFVAQPNVVQELVAQPSQTQLVQLAETSEEDTLTRSASSGRRFCFSTGPRVRENELTPRRYESAQQAISNVYLDTSTSAITSVPTSSRTVFMGQTSSQDTSPVKENFKPPRLMRAISAATSSLMPSPSVEALESPRPTMMDT
jgi:hypothetical protein